MLKKTRISKWIFEERFQNDSHQTDKSFHHHFPKCDAQVSQLLSFQRMATIGTVVKSGAKWCIHGTEKVNSVSFFLVIYHGFEMA